jgi:hypothetical protein
MALGGRPSQHHRSGRRERSRCAVGQRGLRRHAAAVDAERRASICITRPIVSIRWRPTSRNPAQTQAPAPKSQPSLPEPSGLPVSDSLTSEVGSIAVSSIFCAAGKGTRVGWGPSCVGRRSGHTPAPPGARGPRLRAGSALGTAGAAVTRRRIMCYGRGVPTCQYLRKPMRRAESGVQQLVGFDNVSDVVLTCKHTSAQNRPLLPALPSAPRSRAAGCIYACLANPFLN